MDGNPPPVSPLDGGRSGFRRSFALPSLSRGRARPVVVVRELFTRGRDRPHAALRLLQSIRSTSTTAMIETPHDPTSGRPLAQPPLVTASFDVATRKRMASPSFEGGASREVTGQGPCARRISARLLPPRSLVTGASPQPDRLGHLMSRARRAAGWRGQQRRGVLVGGWPHTSPPRQPACAGQRRRPAFAGPSRRATGRACRLFPREPLAL